MWEGWKAGFMAFHAFLLWHFHGLPEGWDQKCEVAEIPVFRAGDVIRISFIMAENVEDSGEHKYRRQWQAFRSHRNMIAVFLLAEFLGFLPFIALVASVEKHLFSTDKMFFPAALSWGALYIFTASRLRNFPCPRCGKNFFGGFFATPETVLGRNCANCGLRRYAEA